MAKSIKPRTIELLSPARNADIAIEAILHGADAVYMGAPSHGARKSAANSLEDIARVVEFAHKYYCRVYVTVNTIVYESELESVCQMIWELYRIGVDALIVQDMSLLRMDLPPISLHASTQCDIRTPQKALFLEKVGFQQLVLPRELTIEQIAEYAKVVSVPLEVFVHGALCVSYSGDCHASCLAKGRSANRGDCAQMCRLPYDLVDAKGNVLAKNQHLLSLKDMCRIDHLQELIDAGASSLKIEGRLKDASYVKNVVGAYSQALDRIVAASDGRLRRLSEGRVELGFEPSLDSAFNRGYTPYFVTRARECAPVSSRLTPKSIGQKVATVQKIEGKFIRIKSFSPKKEDVTSSKASNSSSNSSNSSTSSASPASTTSTTSSSKPITLHNGDGIGYFSRSGEFKGFRVNKVEREKVFPFGGVPRDLTVATALYRSYDKDFEDRMLTSTAERRIDLDAQLLVHNNTLILHLRDGYGHRASASLVREGELQTAKTPQKEARQRVLSKLGDTVYRLRNVDDQASVPVGKGNEDDASQSSSQNSSKSSSVSENQSSSQGQDYFIPASQLTQLRRNAIEAMDQCRACSFPVVYRAKEDIEAKWPEGDTLTYHQNVSNSIAEKFYHDHGVKEIQPALEVEAPKNASGTRAMTTKLCPLRELGMCMRSTEAGKRLNHPLSLVSPQAEYVCKFDCDKCQMQLLVK